MDRDWLHHLIHTALRTEAHANMFHDAPLVSHGDMTEHNVTLSHEDTLKVLVLAKQAGQHDLVQALLRQLPPAMANLP